MIEKYQFITLSLIMNTILIILKNQWLKNIFSQDKNQAILKKFRGHRFQRLINIESWSN